MLLRSIHTVFPLHATHVPVNSTLVMAFNPQKSHYISLLFTRWWQLHVCHLCCIVQASLGKAAYKKNCVCSENFKLYLNEISTSQLQYQCRKELLCVTFRSTFITWQTYRSRFNHNRGKGIAIIGHRDPFGEEGVRIHILSANKRKRLRCLSLLFGRLYLQESPDTYFLGFS